MSGRNVYDTKTQEVAELYRRANAAVKEEQIEQAQRFLDKAIELKVLNLQVYLLKIECELRSQNLTEALKVCKRALDHYDEMKYATKNVVSDKFELFLVRYQIYTQMKDNDQAANQLADLEAFVKQAYEDKLISSEKYKLYRSRIKQESGVMSRRASEVFKGETKELRLQEAKQVLELLQDEQETAYLGKECNLVHVISMKWLEKWKRYSGFYELTGENAIYKLDFVNEDNKELEDQEPPGPIEASDLLEYTDSLIDSDKVKDYCNYQVRIGLQENKDYLIISHRLWKVLYGIYGGVDIKRYVISLGDEVHGTTAVEIWLKKLPPISMTNGNGESRPHTLYISKKESVKDLREKLTRIYKTNVEINPKVNLSSCKLWKLDPRYDYTEALAKLNESRGRVVIRATKMSDGLLLENAEISDDDVIICEYKINNEWVFMSEEEHQAILSNKCANCGSTRNDLFYCECRGLKYCNQACQKQHRPIHREACVQIKGEQSRANEIFKTFKIRKDNKFTSASRYGLVGLQNFGNTCFMNSCLQCLSNIWDLTNYFITNEFIKEINRENTLGTGGKLAAAYGELVKQIWQGSEQYISPWEVKKIVAEVASQFIGYTQQDTQEFLSYLLDGIHEDLNRIKIKPYVEAKEDEGRPDEVFALECWENHLKRNRSIVVDLMHGQYKSKLVCPDCNKVSITFDPFCTLSLPIPIYKIVNISLYFIYKDSTNSSHLKLALNFPPTSPCSEIIQAVSTLFKIPEETLEMKILREHKITIYDLSKYTTQDLKNDDGILFVYQIHCPYIDPPLESFNPKEMLRVEVVINQEVRKYCYSDPKSFYRLLYVDKNQTLKHLHLQVFSIMRVHVASLLANDETLQLKNDLSEENMTLRLLEKQYEELLGLAQSHFLIYSLYQQKPPEEKEVNRAPIPYSNEQKIKSYFKNLSDSTSLMLELTLNPKVRIENMKLNKCKESDQTNQLLNEPKSYSIYDCFNLFIKPEVLDKDNTWYCSQCKDHKQATKTMELYIAPKILIIHLKRFKTNKVSSIGTFFYPASSSKVSILIEYPVNGLDLRDYVHGKYDKEPIYDLFAISNHYGGIGGGHYTAYCKNPRNKYWFDFNDSVVSKQDPAELVTPAAYVLFYQRRDGENNDIANPSSNNNHVESRNGEKVPKTD